MKQKLKHLGKRIRMWRKHYDISFEEFSRRSGVSKGILSKTENGLNNPSLETLSRIAKTFKCSVSNLLVGIF